MKRLASIFTLFILLSLPLVAQETTEKITYRPIQYFIGIQPGFSYEPFDEHKYSYEINVIPIIIEYAINNKWSISLSPTADMLIKPYNLPTELSKIGLGISVPYHFAKKNSEEGHRGFYVAPHGELNMHRLDDFMSTTLAIEMGYKFLFNSVYSFNIGAQYGRTIQLSSDNSFRQIFQHQAAIIALGIWF